MTAIVWFRRDLRVHDHPALTEALASHSRVVPLFVLDPRLLRVSANRTAYLVDCLRALDGELRERGGKLVVRTGDPSVEVARVAAEVGASRVYAGGDVSGFARRRDRGIDGLVLRPGNFIAHLGSLRKRDGGTYSVYTPFRRAWEEQPRRAVLDAPAEIPMPRIAAGELPVVPSPSLLDRPEPGEAAALWAARAWMRSHGAAYGDRRNVLADPTSRMSQHLHFGTISPRVLEELALEHGAGVYRRELAWRDFYAYVLLHGHASRPDPPWEDDPDGLSAWKEGRTGFPVVDAAMRQLLACGWMHNRARMIVASFLTKDLHLDWRLGEAHFMEHLIDGDVGSNNGGWQWVAGTGTDAQPFDRVFNPSLQQTRFDPDGRYVKRWVPELARVPAERLAKPWEMPAAEQEAYGCVIGRDYPPPIVDHLEERRRAIAGYREAAARAR
jgi:deoxyribodipyrimidine photo-lyase